MSEDTTSTLDRPRSPCTSSEQGDNGNPPKPGAEQRNAVLLERLEHKIDHLERRQFWLQVGYLAFLGAGVVCLILGGGLLTQRGSRPPIVCLICFVAAGVFCSFVPIFKARLRFVDGQVLDLEFEKDIIAYAPKKDETRADKLLRMNQHQLRRYHELNLQQSSWVFAIGLMCILIGIVLVGVTMFLVRNFSTDKEKIIVAILGGVGAILTNFVAAIYLHMHSAATKNLNDFHGTLVATQQLFLANLIASRIEPDDKRWETLAQISLSMIGKRS